MTTQGRHECALAACTGAPSQARARQQIRAPAGTRVFLTGKWPSLAGCGVSTQSVPHAVCLGALPVVRPLEAQRRRLRCTRVTTQVMPLITRSHLAQPVERVGCSYFVRPLICRGCRVRDAGNLLQMCAVGVGLSNIRRQRDRLLFAALKHKSIRCGVVLIAQCRRPNSDPQARAQGAGADSKYSSN